MLKHIVIALLLLLPAALHAAQLVGEVGQVDVIPVKGKATYTVGDKPLKFSVPVAKDKSEVGFILDQVDKGVEFTAVVHVTDDGVNFQELCRGAGVGDGKTPVSISCGDRFTNKASLTRQFQGTFAVTKGTTQSAIDAVIK